MYNYKRANSSNESHYIVPLKSPRNWMANSFFQWNISAKWHGQSRLLATNSPTISACTTATNLSSLDLPQTFGSSSFNNRRMGTLEKNVCATQPEIQPLRSKEKLDEKSIKSCIDSGIIYKQTTTKKPQKRNQVIAALSVSLVSMIIGFVSAYTSPAAESLKDELKITENEFSWVCSIMPLTALLGGLLGGMLIETIGRKFTIILTDLLFIISLFTMAVAHQPYMLYISRIISGCGVGIASLVLPVYLGETVQPEIRGSLGLLPTAFGNIGILLCFTSGIFLKWQGLAWLGVVLPIPFLLLAFVIPETPRWFISKGKIEQSEKALKWLRGKNSNIQEEFKELCSCQEKNNETNSSYKNLLNSSNLKPLLIVLGLMFFQQMSGINAVIFYTTDIFKMSGSTIEPKLCTIIVGIVNFISTFIATVVIDKLGRKVLLYISAISMFITLSSLGTYFLLTHLKYDMSAFGWLPLGSFIIYILGFSLGFGPIPWLMMGEILPTKVRERAASVATSFNWCCTFIVTKLFINILELIGPYGTFWSFAVIMMLSIIFIAICVPETRGRSLYDIEKQYAKKSRRISSVANLKTLTSTLS